MRFGPLNIDMISGLSKFGFAFADMTRDADEKCKGMVSETSFDKRFALGRNVDQDRITAKLNKKKGELTVETPKLKALEGTDKIIKTI